MALPLQATDCGDTTRLSGDLHPWDPSGKEGWITKKRTHEIKIRLSQAELDSLNAQVGKTQLSREQFCRNAIRGVTIRENPPADLHKLIWEIRRVGNNIDQILTIANAKGLLDVPHLRQSISDLREVEKMIVSAYE